MFKIMHYAYFDYEGANNTLRCREEQIGDPIQLTGLTEASLSVELNTAGTLELVIPYRHRHYNLFELYVSELAVFQNETEIWRGYVSEISKDFDGNKTVKAEGILAYLSMSVKKFNKGTNLVNSAFISTLISNHNSQVAPDGSNNGKMPNRTFSMDTVNVSGSVIIKDDTDYDSTWSYIENQLINEYAGFVKVWRNNGVNKISYKTVSGETNTAITQQIKFGVNLLDLDISYNTEDFMTVLYAKGKDANGKNDHLYTNNPIKSNKAITKYGLIYRFENFENANGDANIKKAADKKLSDSGIIYRIEANALDMHNAGVNVDAIVLGNHHSIVCNHCGLDGNNDFCVERIEYNLLYWEETTFTFGRTEKIWIIDQEDPSYDPDDAGAYLYTPNDPSLTKNSVDSYNKVTLSASRANVAAEEALSTADDALSTANDALTRANESPTTSEMATAINGAISSAQATFEINTVEVENTIETDVTVRQFVDAINAGKGIVVILEDGPILSTISGYSYSENDGYTCVINLVVAGSVGVATGLQENDTIILTLV